MLADLVMVPLQLEVAPAEEPPDVQPAEDPHAVLEMMHIDAYLLTRGHTRKNLFELAMGERRRLMVEASIYTSSRLAEAETRATLLRVLRGQSA